LLPEAADLMVQRVVQRDTSIDFDGQAPRLREVGIPNAVLRASAAPLCRTDGQPGE
jgi:hypothetical protein